MEREIFLEVAEKYSDMVYRIALNYFGNTYDAEDTVQEAMLRLFKSEKSFENDAHVRNWLIRVTINICKSALRMVWRRNRVELEELSEIVEFDQPEDKELFLTVMALPEKYRTVLYLFYYEEFSVREMAKLLQIKETSVTTRLARARGMLKQKLTEA